MSTATDTHAAQPTFRHVFGHDELDAIQNCLDEHGFAVVRRVISDETVAALKRDIDRSLNPNNDLKPAETRYAMVFIEQSPTLLALLDNPAFMAVARKVVGSEQIVVNRSAAILKNAGAKAGGWHSDFDFSPGPVNASMNRGEWPNGLWFYLTGSHPTQGGLAVIDGSHRPDWPGPKGFVLREDRNWFEPAGGKWDGIDPFRDVPGVVPLVTEPSDLVIFAARTYHAPHAHQGQSPRYSATVVFRPRMKMNVDWPLSEQAQQFLASLSERHRPYFEDYTSLKG